MAFMFCLMLLVVIGYLLYTMGAVRPNGVAMPWQRLRGKGRHEVKSVFWCRTECCALVESLQYDYMSPCLIILPENARAKVCDGSTVWVSLNLCTGELDFLFCNHEEWQQSIDDETDDPDHLQLS